MTAFKLAHLSDPHLPPLPEVRFGELTAKRVLGYLNWVRNRRKYHRRDVLDALLSDMQAQVPDHVTVTGDIVNLALEAEFKQSLAWLKDVGAGDRVTIIPGNHDIYVRATQHRFSQVLSAYLRDDSTSVVAAGFPFVRRRGPLTLIGASTAVPTLPLSATGTLGHTQLKAIEDILAALSGTETFRVLLVHHPLKSDARAKRLTDASGLIAILKRHGVDLVLHGHDHVHSTVWLDGPNGAIPAIGVPSASAIAHGRHPAAAYNLFSIERDGAAWRCEQTVRGIDSKFRVRELRRTLLNIPQARV
jgi:3',5'-cyclic AMP phosphodiesterase CpdA